MRSATLLVAGSLAWALASGCGGSAATGEDARTASPSLGPAAATVALLMRDIAFEPVRLEMQANQVAELTIENRGNIVHDLTIDRMPAGVSVVRAGGRMSNGRADLHIALDGGKRAVVRLQVKEPGEYRFYCSVPGHLPLGMEGTLTVR